MKERIEKLKAEIAELRSDAFGEQYGYADIADRPGIQAILDKLSTETALYDRILKEIQTFES